jgi:hypothetical protein
MRKTSRVTAAKALLVLAAIFIAAGCSAFIFADRIFSFAVNNFTDYHISYQRWGESPFDRKVLFSPVLELRDRGIALKAEKAEFEIDAAKLLKNRQVSLGCSFDNATFELSGAKGDLHDIVGLILSPGQLFGNIRFLMLADSKEIAIRSLYGESEDIRIEGDYLFKRDNTYVSLDIKLSVSPSLASLVAEDIRSSVLTLDDDGWYSTIIDYRGNPIFLKALYMFTSP